MLASIPMGRFSRGIAEKKLDWRAAIETMHGFNKAVVVISMPTISSHLKPQSLGELLSFSVEEIGCVDIGRANLLCATGLPGAEELNVEEHVGRLDAWASRIHMMTKRHLPHFPSISEQFDYSEPKWRLCVMAKLLHDECKVGYHEARIDSEPDWTDSQDLLIHGITGSRRKGTCPSLPVFFVAIGRRLGYPMFLAKAPAHSFSRWEAPEHENAAWQETLNIEFHGHVDFRDDERYYDWPVSWPNAAREKHRRRDSSMPFVQSLPPTEEFAHSLCQRGICLEASGQYVEAVETYLLCRRYDQRWKGYLPFLKRTLRARAEQVMRSMGYEPNVFRSWVFPHYRAIEEYQLLGGAATSVGSLRDRIAAEAAFAQVAAERKAAAAALNPAAATFAPANPHERPAPPHINHLVETVLQRTCAGTPIPQHIDLLIPHPPEPEVAPYGSHCITD